MEIKYTIHYNIGEVGFSRTTNSIYDIERIIERILEVKQKSSDTYTLDIVVVEEEKE